MTATESYDLNDLQHRAEHIRFILDEIEECRYDVDRTLTQSAEILTQYLQDTENAIPPWEDLKPENNKQLELDLE